MTGTNGKTTTTYLVEAMLRAAGAVAGRGRHGHRTAVRVPGGARPAPFTTPGALVLHELLRRRCARRASRDVVIEATSHALELGRARRLRFRVAALTNLTQDHLDFHGDDADATPTPRRSCSSSLIDPTRGVAVTFVDDEWGARCGREARGRALGVARDERRRTPTSLVERSAAGRATARTRRSRRRSGGCEIARR